MRRLNWIVITFAFLVPSVATWSGAPEPEGLLNKLLAPGPLSEGHKDLERSQCLACHEAGKGIPHDKCLDCHKDIRREVESKKGFHGLTEKSCFECHAEHKGRDFDSTHLDEKKFDHALTGFKLEGKHSDLKCVECHLEKRKKKPVRPDGIRYFGNKSTCLGCHKKEDPHFFRGPWAKKDCNACHGLISWKKEIRFNHEKDTHFKLQGHHSEMHCQECHVPKGGASSRYKWKELEKEACLSCHANYHQGGLAPKFQGGRCDTCHSQDRWKFNDTHPFDHGVTHFRLKGKHEEIDCTKCHIQPKRPIAVTKSGPVRQWKGVRSDCLACHQDFHRFGSHRSSRFKNSADCLSCHDEKKWNSIHSFNHNQSTRYPITGKHLDVACNECHISKDWKKKLKTNPNQPGVYAWPKLDSKTCENCHQSPHLKTFSAELLKKQCTDCHVTQGWNVVKTGKGEFNHDRETRFKLTGKHSKIDCNQCHLIGGKQVYKLAGAEKDFCVTCHKNVHETQFSTKFAQRSCSECHTTQDFTERLKFNHDLTRYKIVGAHNQLKCVECHVSTSKILETKPPKPASQYLFPNLSNETCSPCHKNIHREQFSPDFRSRACLDCHTEKSFKDRKIFNHDLSRYKVQGKHEKVACEKCHVPTANWLETKPQKRASKFYFPSLNKDDCALCHKDPHRGGFGKACSECHEDRGWRVTRDFHKNFTLEGVHFTLQCVECHKGDRRLGGMSQNCFFCHQKDDVHLGTLPNCGQCHKQHFWENAEYKHSLSRFPLRGIHRTLECADCHRQGIYQGLPNRCSDCHLSASMGVAFPVHTLPAFMDCARCHNQFSFK